MKVIDRFVDTRPLRSSRAFRRLWIGSTASAFGSQLTVVAVLFQTWELTGSPVWVGAIGIFHAVPMIIAGLLGGTLADAVDRRLLVIVSTFGCHHRHPAAGRPVLRHGAVGAGDPGSGRRLRGLHVGRGAGPPHVLSQRLLDRDQIPAGIALTHLGFQGALLAGPAVAGSSSPAGDCRCVTCWMRPPSVLRCMASPACRGAASAMPARAGVGRDRRGLAVHRPPAGAARFLPDRSRRHRAGHAGGVVPDDQRRAVRRPPGDARVVPLGDRSRRDRRRTAVRTDHPGAPARRRPAGRGGRMGCDAGRVRAGRSTAGWPWVAWRSRAPPTPLR